MKTVLGKYIVLIHFSNVGCLSREPLKYKFLVHNAVNHDKYLLDDLVKSEISCSNVPLRLNLYLDLTCMYFSQRFVPWIFNIIVRAKG